MILADKKSTLDSVRAENRFLRVLVLSIVALVVAVLFAAVSFAPKARTVLVPPVLHQSFWVDDDRPGPEYLEEMGYFIARAYLDLTPDNLEFNLRLLLRYAHPSLHGLLQKEMLAARDRLRTENASTQAVFTELRTDPVRYRVALLGSHTTYIAGRNVGTAKKAWVIEFGYASGRINLMNIRETAHDDPFGDKKPVAGRP